MSRQGSLRAAQRKPDRSTIAISAFAAREAGMAVTQSGTSVAGGGHPPKRTSRFRGIWLWTTIAALFVAVAAIVLGSLARAYQPLSMWGNLIGCLSGMHCGDGVRTVNTFGAQTGELYIPPQHRTFAVSV